MKTTTLSRPQVHTLPPPPFELTNVELLRELEKEDPFMGLLETLCRKVEAERIAKAIARLPAPPPHFKAERAAKALAALKVNTNKEGRA